MKTKNTAISNNQLAGQNDWNGIYCYIGPSLRGLIQHGMIWRGTRADALTAAKAAIDAQPLVKTMIVSGDALPAARRKVKTPGNALYENYRRIAGTRKGGTA